MDKVQNKAFSYLVGLVFIVVTLHSCDSKTTYTEVLSISNAGWSINDTLIFTPIIEDNTATYNIYAWVRHSKSYKYSNIWLKLIAELDIIENERGLIEIPIADKAGVWFGECTQSMCTSKVLLKENYQFEKSGAFKVEVLQYMREDILKEVKDVGLEFELVE